MRLSNVHALYWASRQAPPWVRGNLLPGPSIDACVNAHGGPPDPRSALPLALMSPASRGRRRAQLQHIASEPSIGGRTSREAANALKWLRRLERADALAWWRGRSGLTGAALDAYDRAIPATSFSPTQLVERWRNGPGRRAVKVWASHMVKFHDTESHEIITPADMRMGQAMSDEQQVEMNSKPGRLYRPGRYLKD